MERELPDQDSHIQRLTADIREDMRQHARQDLFFLAKGVLGYADLTESCHMPLTVFLDSNPAQFKLALMPRDHLKTTIATISGSIQKALRNSNERILIANESATNAERMLRAIRQQFESNRVLRALFSDLIPDTRKVRWNDQELDLRRDGVWPEPTFDTIGMTGAVTSRHYSHMCFDDPISEEAVKSERVMEDTINRMNALLLLLSNPETDTAWFVGTRWALHDVYSRRMEVMGSKLAKLVRSAIEGGKPIWPERFSLERLAMIYRDMGPYKFSCLMMNSPRNEEIQDLNTQHLRYWRWAGDNPDSGVIVMYDLDGVTEHRRVQLDQLDVTTTVDLAPAEKTSSDRNAVVTVGITPWNQAVVLDAWGSRCTPLELIDAIIDAKQRYGSRRIGIEGVAYQKAFKYFLRQRSEERGVYLNIVELKAIGKKEHRVRGLQPVMAVGRLWVHPTALMLINEMNDFPLGEHDDVVDALAMQLQLWRGVLSPEEVERSARERKRLVSRIRGYSLLGDPGVRQLPSGQYVPRDDDDDDDDDDEYRYRNWEEVTEQDVVYASAASRF